MSIRAPVAIAFIPLEKATNMRRLSCKSNVVKPPSQKMRLYTVKPIINIPNTHYNVAKMLGLVSSISLPSTITTTQATVNHIACESLRFSFMCAKYKKGEVIKNK